MTLPDLPINAGRIERDLMELARLTEPDRPYTRLAFSALDREARDVVAGWMREAGLDVSIDAAGNTIGRRNGRADGPVVAIGSHTDTVQAGGRFDGIAGVVAAVEVARALAETGVVTEHPLEVVNFNCEEPSVPGMTPVGSRAISGHLDLSKLHTARDPQGRTLAEAIDYLGGDHTRLADVIRSPGDVHGYLELHIEQGLALERAGRPVGIVTHIAGPARGAITAAGRADHAGATLMDERKDALCAAAEVILALERAAKDPSLRDAVATIGAAQIMPGMVNIIPGRVDLQVEVRSIRQEEKERVKDLLAAACEAIARERGIQIDAQWLVDELPVTVPDRMQALLREAAEELGVPELSLPSRAMHDASWMAMIAPVGMVFVPSKDGLSHTPDEWTDFADVATGASVLGRALLKLDAAQ